MTGADSEAEGARVARERRPVGRLAPSPTGALHLGNARSFLLAWLSIRARGGTLPCRIEDLDGPRVKPGSIAQTLADLAWLGLSFDGEVVYQSARLALYAEALAKLRARDLVYPCVCTRGEIERAQSAPQDAADHGTRYPGTCRGRFASGEEARAASGREPAWRFRVPEGRVQAFDDGLLGRVEIDVAADCGDFVVAKRDGLPAYQCAVVVDDAAQGVTEVLRGDDLTSSTPRQLLLYEALGLDAPGFVHVPLVAGTDGRRLAKRHGDTRVARYRDAGVAPEALVGFLAWSCGLQDEPAPCAARELVAGFTLERIGREPFVLTRLPWEA